jgi:hypothetical protein
MASGHVNRTKRPNTWLHRPACGREESPCQLGAVHTWHGAAIPNVRFHGESWRVSGRATEIAKTTFMDPKATFGASFIAGKTRSWNTSRARIAFPDIMQDAGGSAFLASVFRAMGRRFHDRGSDQHAQRRDDRAFE